MNAKSAVEATVDPWMPHDLPRSKTAPSRLSQQESEEAFKIVVTLREAIEAANSVEQRIEGTSDPRYATFLAKARDRHRQIAESARDLLIEMVVTMSDERVGARGTQLTGRSG